MKTEEILSRLLDGEHVEINEYEIFETYAGGYWIRREMTAEEMEKEGFETTEELQSRNREYTNNIKHILNTIQKVVEVWKMSEAVEQELAYLLETQTGLLEKLEGVE